MTRVLAKKPTEDARVPEGGIEWIVARRLAPIQDELLRLRANVEALREEARLW